MPQENQDNCILSASQPLQRTDKIKCHPSLLFFLTSALFSLLILVYNCSESARVFHWQVLWTSLSLNVKVRAIRPLSPFPPLLLPGHGRKHLTVVLCCLQGESSCSYSLLLTCWLVGLYCINQGLLFPLPTTHHANVSSHPQNTKHHFLLSRSSWLFCLYTCWFWGSDEADCRKLRDRNLEYR